MKKWQYSISIVVAFIGGGLLGLYIGDSRTAVLAGVAFSGGVAWILSLDWGSSRKLFRELSEKMSVKGAGDAIGRCVWWWMKALVSLIVSIPYCMFFRDKQHTRAVLGMLLVVSIAIVLFMNGSILKGSAPLVIEFTCFIATGVALCGAAVYMAISLLMIWMDTYESVFNKNNEELGQLGNSNVFLNFAFIWEDQFIFSEKNTFYAFIDLIVIRTMNALRMIVFPFVFAVWGMYALSTNKTGLSVICAMGLTYVQLTISNVYGGIIISNINFWLLLFIGAGIGAVIGKKIHDGFGEKISEYDFQMPKLVLKSQQ